MSVMPKRIQRKRTKGWKMPPNTVYVGRPTKWGNPFVVSNDAARVAYYAERANVDGWRNWPVADRETAVARFREHIKNWIRNGWNAEQLRGKDLACWCPLDQPCHADVLLEIANAEVAG